MKRIPLSLLALALMLIPAIVFARTPMQIQPVMTGVDDLVARFSKLTEQHPDSAEAFYRLGRVHDIAAVLKLGKIGIDERTRMSDTLPELNALNIVLDRLEAGLPVRGEWPEYLFINAAPPQPGVEKQPPAWPGGVELNPVPPDFAWTHLNQALPNLRQAIRLDPKNPRYHLVLASVLETYAHDDHLQQDKTAKNPGLSAADALLEAVVEYMQAFDLAMKTEGNLASRPVCGLHSLITYEAAQACLPLLDKVNPPDAAAAERWPVEKKQMATFIDFFEKLPVYPNY